MISKKVGTYFFRLFLPFILLVNLSLALGISFSQINMSSIDTSNTYFGFTSFISFLNDLDIFKDSSSDLFDLVKLFANSSVFNLPNLFSSSIFSSSWWSNFGLFTAWTLVQPAFIVVLILMFAFIIGFYIINFLVALIRALNGYYNMPIEHVINFPDLVNNLRNFLPLIL